MRILRLYLAREMLKGWLIVMVVLATVFTLMLMIEEMDRVNARYTMPDAMRYLAGTLPTRIVDLAPVTVLLGTLLALGNMARHNEIIVMRGAGMSLPLFLRNVGAPILLMAIGLAAFSEFVASPLYQEAEIKRQVLRSGRLNLLGKEGLWANEGNRFINVRRLHLGQIPRGIELYHFDDDGRLVTAIRSPRAEVSQERHWTLRGVQRKDFSEKAMRTRRERALDIGPFWSERELPVVANSPTGMSPSGLHQYIRHLEDTGQKSDRLRLLFWQKVGIPFSAAAMVLLAVPIAVGLGSGRSGNFGIQLAVGALLGVGFYMVSQIFYNAFNAGLLAQLPPFVAGTAPIALVLLLAIVLMYARR